jgi:hypothetical protein
VKDLPLYRHTAVTRHVLTSLVPVICPPEAAPLADAIVAHMELMLGATARALQLGLGAGMVAYDLGALPRYRTRARYLTGDAALRYFQSWADGPTPVHAQLALALAQLMRLACYEQPAMMERVGYRVGPWIEQVTHKRLTVYKDDVAAQERQIVAPDPLRPVAADRAEHKESA